jgi:hypothetical protein
MRYSQPSDRLTVRIGQAIQFVLLLPDLLLNPLYTIHHGTVSRDFGHQQLVTDLVLLWLELLVFSDC